MFNIGERVLHVRRRHSTRYVDCPDCFGQKYLTVILGDKSTVTIACDQCKSPGSDWSTGRVPKTVYGYTVEEAVIDRITLEYGGMLYDLTPGGNAYPEFIFSMQDRPAAEACAAKRQLDADALEAKEPGTPSEHQKKSWAWNVRYHRQCIRGAENDIAYHRARLDYARHMAKDEKGKSLVDT